MVGFIKGFFGSKPKTEESEAPESEAPVTPEPQSKAYYLPPDDAKTFGNIDYMRSSKTIRRSFPKAKLGEDNEVIRAISAMEMKQSALESQGIPPAPIKAVQTEPDKSTPTPIAPTSETEERRRTDTSMDMFRSMAKDLKKR